MTQVTGFAMTQAAAAPSPVLGAGTLNVAGHVGHGQHVPLPGLPSLGLQGLHGMHSHGLNLASSINSFAAPVSPVHALGVGGEYVGWPASTARQSSSGAELN